ncbi:MAG: S8 family serine peptidase [Caldilineaceae bacterium]|nr:S8 family serine peptidase [Caldilineaceae bacterium]
MKKQRFATIMTLILAFCMVLTPVVYAEDGIPALTDGAQDKADPKVSHRLIVELDAPPLAAAYGAEVRAADAGGRLKVQSADSQAYISQLQAQQAAFVSRMQSALEGAQVSTFINELGMEEQATYQIVFNGMSIDPGSIDPDQAKSVLERMPGVKAIYPDYAYSTDLYTSTALINAPMVWDALGGTDNAGAGVKFASMDGGVHKDAPMFDGTGYEYPDGFQPNGIGLTENNNGKIIASRTYFRPWDPPADGDENPWPGIAGTSHGVHTASTAAGNCVDNVTYLGYDVGSICGVAPHAYVMSYRVFYESVTANGSFYTTEGIAALEDIVADGADVVNNSWGGGPFSEGGVFDPLDAALINAVEAGVFVSMSTGNAGPELGTGDHPSADYINVAASTTSGTLAAGRLGVQGDAELQNLAFAASSFGSALPLGQVLEFDYLPAIAVDPANFEGCEAWPADSFTGKTALISRGGCEFGVKVLNAEQAGAEFAIVYNHADGGEELSNMAPGEVGNQATIPSIFIGNTDGEALVAFYDANGADAAILELSTIAFQAGNTPDKIINFSSRGPGVGNVLKPDIAAPGVNILAQGYAEGVTGEARHLGYGQASGTSMASPHVAGTAVMLRQLYPDWSNAAIKSAMMSTSKYMDMYNFDGSPAQPLDMGAGRLDAAAAMDPGVILDPPSLSYGLVASGAKETITVQVTNIADAAETYSVSTLYTGNGFTQTMDLPGFSASPTSVTLAPGESAAVEVTFDSAQGMGYGDNQGYIIMTGDQGHTAHMPAWARVTHAEQAADVLIIDADASSTLGNYNYLWYYTSTLDELGYSYEVLNADANFAQPATIPDAVDLLAYDAVVLFTGEAYRANGTFPVATPITEEDRAALLTYLNSGGTLIVMGQDFASWLDAAATDDPGSGTGGLLYTRLGANYIQDSVSDNGQPAAMITATNEAPPALNGTIVDLTGIRKYDGGAVLSGENEVPAVASDAGGEFSFTYDVDQNLLEVAVSVVPTVTAPLEITGMHIHVGAAGENGPVVRSLEPEDGFFPVTITETLDIYIPIVDLTGDEINAMLAGNYYVNVHTVNNPDGELRGQMEPAPYAVQAYVDEVANVYMSTESPIESDWPDGLQSIPLLTYNGPNNLYEGYVALARRDVMSLERPGTTYSGRSVYTTFGLEGMDEAGGATRAELLGAFLTWAWTEPGAVNIADTSPADTDTTSFTATMSEVSAAAADQPNEIVGYRWDFGDGSDYVMSTGNTVSHQYVCSDSGNVYSVRAELTDDLGIVSIGEAQMDVSDSCRTPTAIDDETPNAMDAFQIFLPVLERQ